MAVVSTVKLSELEGAERVDAEYYEPRYIQLAEKIRRQHQFFTLRSIRCTVVSGPFGSSLKSEAYLAEGVPFIRIQNLEDFFIDTKELVYISQEDNERLRSSGLRAGDLVLSKVGNTIGVVSIVTDDIGNCNISENNIGIKFPTSVGVELKSYVLTFLNSNLGRQQILRKISGNAQPKLNVQDIYELVLCLPSKGLVTDVNDLVCRSRVLSNLAKSYYSQAENLLLEELGLKDFKPKYELSYTANLSQAFGAHRVDAEYFQPASDEVIKRMIDYCNGYTPLSDCVEIIRTDFDPTKHLDETFPYVELSNIDASIGVIHSASEIKGKDAPSRARRVLRKDDVIVSSVEGSLEKVALVDEEHEGSLASTGFFQFRARTISPEALLILSKSIALQAQLKKECAGTILTAVPNESLKRILVPLLPPETQQKITSFVQQSHEARRKAKQLLEEAKRKVEQMIESASGSFQGEGDKGDEVDKHSPDEV